MPPPPISGEIRRAAMKRLAILAVPALLLLSLSFLLLRPSSPPLLPSIPDDHRARLSVYLADLPRALNHGLLDLYWSLPHPDSRIPASSDPDHPPPRGGHPPYPASPLIRQYSAEYWLLASLLRIPAPDSAAVRVVADWREADVVFVPFFASLSFNRHASEDRALQRRLLDFLAARPEWRRSGGRDHVVLAHHPNGMLHARYRLWPCVFVLCDFGRYPHSVANVDKDVVAPYLHMVDNFFNDTAGYNQRPTLLYFQGAIYRKDGGFIRQELYYLLKDEKDVHFSFGSVAGNGIEQSTRGMRASKFCLNIAGDTPSSNRLFDSIVSHCVPIIISDEIELPFEDVIDYSKFCIIVRGADAVKKDFLINLIKGISQEEWTSMWNKLKEVERHFEYQYPSQPDDAVQMIWKTIARKVPSIRLKINRLRRFSRFEANKTNESPARSSWLRNQAR